MSGVATAIVVTGVMAQQSAKKQARAAADAQARALGYQDASEQKALEEQRRQFDLMREDTATQRRVGDESLNYMQSLLQTDEYAPQKFEMGDFQTDPGYQFRLEQGAQARGNVLGAQGMKLSGRAQKELERYGQDYGSQEYGNVYGRRMGEFQQEQADKQNYLARLGQLAGYGAEGIRTATAAGSQAAGQMGNIITGAGANRANIASQYGTDVANIQGQKYANYNTALQSGIGNYLAYNQNQRMNDLFRRQQAGDAYMPAYGRGY